MVYQTMPVKDKRRLRESRWRMLSLSPQAIRTRSDLRELKKAGLPHIGKSLMEKITEILQQVEAAAWCERALPIRHFPRRARSCHCAGV